MERKNAAKALACFVRLHPHNIAQKTEVMVEHFIAVTRHRSGGRAKAMLVTGSRLEAVRYKQSFDRYITSKGYPIKSLVAFSGEVRDDRVAGVSYTEEQMNAGIREKELPEHFATPEDQVLLVAEKYQTGFDQPCCTPCTSTNASPASRRCRPYPGSIAPTRTRKTPSCSTS